MISNFLNLLTDFMTYHVIYPWEYFMYPWEECVFCSCWVECSVCVYYVNLVFSVALFFHFLIDLHSGWFTRYWKWRIDISLPVTTLLPFPSLLSVFCFLMFHMFDCSDVGCVYSHPSVSMHSCIFQNRCAQNPYIKWQRNEYSPQFHTHRFHICRWSQLWVEISIHGWVDWIHGCKQGEAHYMFILKNRCRSGPMWFKPVLQPSELYIYNYYIFLVNWPFYHHVMSLSLVTIFILMSILCDIIDSSCSLLVCYLCRIYFLSFCLRSIYVLKSWVSLF